MYKTISILLNLISMIASYNYIYAQSFGWAYLPVDCPVSWDNSLSHANSTTAVSQTSTSFTNQEISSVLTDAYTQSLTNHYPSTLSGTQDPYCHFSDEKYAYIYFVDIYQSPFKSSINTLIKYCIVRGRGDSYQKFYPGYNITDEEFIKIVTKSLSMSDRVKKSDQGDHQRSDKYYDKALEMKLISKLPDQKIKGYGVTKKQAYILIYEGLKLTNQKWSINRYVSYYNNPMIAKQYLTRGQTADMIVKVLGLK